MSVLKLDFALMADYCTATRDSKLVIAGEFDIVNATKMPTRLRPCAIAFRVVTTHPVASATVEVFLVDPAREELRVAELTSEMASSARPDLRRTSHIVELVNVPLKAFGLHRMEIREGGFVLGAAYFDVRKVEPPTAKT